MFDIGFWEIGVIAVIALLILGPERLPKAARTAGLWVGRARRVLSEVKSDIDREIKRSELEDLSTDLKNAQNVIERNTAILAEPVDIDEPSTHDLKSKRPDAASSE